MSRRLPIAVLAVALSFSWFTHFAWTDEALELPTPETVLQTLHPEHPRVLVRAERFAELREMAKTDLLLKLWIKKLGGEAEQILAQPPSKYEIPDGKRLLATSRRVRDRVLTLALLYRLQGDRRYVSRVWAELSTAAEFKDWNPSHFLDTAEMTAAFAIGYDWLYDEWTPEQRKILREAIVKHGFTPGMKGYRGEARYGWWSKSHHNWNQVCNGGLTMGAIAIAEEAPELAAEIVAHAIKGVPLAMRSYAPSGGWFEGPGYWNYATSYNVQMLSTLKSGLGTDFGLSTIEGFEEAPLFPMYMTGRTGICYNFADAKAGTIRPWQNHWFSATFDRPEFASYALEYARPYPSDLLFYDPRGKAVDWTKAPRDFYFPGVEAASLRSDWKDPDALWLAFKAGRTDINHSNLDVGSFVMEALGQRWFIDLGPDDYNLPAYFGDKRWTYFRMRAEAHSTLVINPDRGPDQDLRAYCKIAEFQPDDDNPTATLDLTAAYQEHARRVTRTFTMPGRTNVRITDEVELKEPGEIWSFFVTDADVSLAADGRSATLAKGGKKLTVALLSPPHARLSIMPAEPLPTSPNPAGQRENPGVRKLTVRLKDVSSAKITVGVQPSRAEPRPSGSGPRVR